MPEIGKGDTWVRDYKDVGKICKGSNPYWSNWEELYETSPPINLEEFMPTSVKYSHSSSHFLSVLRDYARMAEAIFGKGFDKYPKNVKQAHDDIIDRYNDEMLARQEKVKLDAGDGYLKYEDKEYLIRFPETAAEILDEGKTLHHCVGGYVQDVIDGKTTILFLREKANPSKPFYTIEVRDGSVRQVRGDRNCRVTYNVGVFVDTWKKKFALR